MTNIEIMQNVLAKLSPFTRFLQENY